MLEEMRPSGAERMLLAAAPHWHAAGVELKAVAVADAVGDFAVQLEDAGYEILHLPVRGALDLRSFFRFLGTGVDVLHIHPERGNGYYAATARLAGVRSIAATIHNVFPFGGALRVERIALRLMMRSMGVLQIACSESVRQNERVRFFNPTRLIWNWYDDNHFFPPSQQEREEARRRYDVQGADLVVVSLGACTAWKNHSALIRAVGMLQRELDLRYLHVGPELAGSPESELAGRLGLGDRARFVGAVTDPRDALWAADIFVMPSIREGLPLAPIEAMACGIPCVLSSVDGLVDFRIHTADIDWMFPSAENIAAAIQLVASRSAEHNRAIGTRLSSVARHSFGVERGAREYLDIYGGLAVR